MQIPAIAELDPKNNGKYIQYLNMPNFALTLKI